MYASQSMSQQQAGTTTSVIKDTTPPVRAPQSSPHAITGAAVSTCIKGRTAQGQETKGCARLAAKEIQQNPDNDHPHVGDLGYARCRVHTLRISVSKDITTTTMMALVSPSCRQLSPRPDMKQTMYCHRTFASHSRKATGSRVSGTFAADVYSTQVPLPQEHTVSDGGLLSHAVMDYVLSLQFCCCIICLCWQLSGSILTSVCVQATDLMGNGRQRWHPNLSIIHLCCNCCLLICWQPTL